MISALADGPILYPFLITAYPILFAWSHNIEVLTLFTNVAKLAMHLAVAMAITLGAVALLGLILKDWRRTALIVGALLVMFFGYGHVRQFIMDADFPGYPRHKYFLPVWAGLGLAGSYIALRVRGDLRNVTNMLNVIAAFLVIISLIDIASFKLSPGARSSAFSGGAATSASVTGTQSETGRVSPDIYYIIADAYTNSLNLQERFGYDNSEFTGYLTGKGFFVNYDSRPNYPETFASLASSLNMEHLDYLADAVPEGSNPLTVHANLIRGNKVMSFLRARGYKILQFKQGWLDRENDGRGDLYVGCEKGTYFRYFGGDFTEVLFSTTLLDPFLKRFGVVQSGLRVRRLCDFSRIIEVTDTPGPKFVFAHLAVPHPPWVFGPNGEEVQSETAEHLYLGEQGYLDQLIFVNKKLREVVDGLLTGQDNPPVIIIQGDHGSGFLGDAPDEDAYREKMGILNAYHLPNGGNDLLYESITPVNTFRVVFNHYFGQDFGLLDDTSHFQPTGTAAFKYLDVTTIVSERSD
ncbi:MAG: hypothetical protein QGI50_10245 [Dehalococcoidia bacterium]|nr:hypothetical protein [Dehalococcoidia bacterium]